MLIYFSFYQILFIFCEYIMGIVLFYLYDPVFFNHTIASRKLNIYILAHHFILLRLNPFDLRVDREGWWFEHSVS